MNQATLHNFGGQSKNRVALHGYLNDWRLLVFKTKFQLVAVWLEKKIAKLNKETTTQVPVWMLTIMKFQQSLQNVLLYNVEIVT